MHSTRKRPISHYTGAAVIASLAMAVSGVSGATVLSAKARAVPNPLFSQAGNSHPWNWRCSWCAFKFSPLRGVASSDALDNAAIYLVPVSADSASLVPVEFAGAVTTSLENGTSWRSNSFSIAGSRIWMKVIKFSATGINLRVPLN